MEKKLLCVGCILNLSVAMYLWEEFNWLEKNFFLLHLLLSSSSIFRNCRTAVFHWRLSTHWKL